MREDNRLNMTVGYKVTPIQKVELQKLIAEAGYLNMTDFLRSIVGEFVKSHKQGSRGHVNRSREAVLDETCALFREFLELKLTKVADRQEDDEIVAV